MASFAAGDPDPALEMQAPGKSKPRRRLAGLMTSQHLSAKPPVRNALRRSQQSTKQDAQQDSVHAGKDEDAMETETAEEGHPQGAERASSCGTGEVADVQEALQLLLADLSDMTSQVFFDPLARRMPLYSLHCSSKGTWGHQTRLSHGHIAASSYWANCTFAPFECCLKDMICGVFAKFLLDKLYFLHHLNAVSRS